MVDPDAPVQIAIGFGPDHCKAAANLYTDLAAVYAATPEVSKMFQVLAQEEAHHKLLIEREYDEKV